jgi:hypothetical protein
MYVQSQQNFRRQVESPGKRDINYNLHDLAYDPEVNRALARELYIDATVNVVNPAGQKKGSPSKVKPGQMNLFNPIGQKQLTHEFEVVDVVSNNGKVP